MLCAATAAAPTAAPAATPIAGLPSIDDDSPPLSGSSRRWASMTARLPERETSNRPGGKRVVPAVAANGSSNYLQRAPSPSGLADVLNVILDKGIVIDAFVRVSMIGIELVTIDARIVIASVDTYLRFAEAVNRLDLAETAVQGLPELEEVGAKAVTEHEIDEVEEEAGSALRSAAKGVAAGAAVVGAAAVAKHVIDSRSEGEE